MSRWAIFRWCMYAKPSTTWCMNLTTSASNGTLSSSMTFCRSPPGALEYNEPLFISEIAMVLTPRSRRFGFRAIYFSPSSTKNCRYRSLLSLTNSVFTNVSCRVRRNCLKSHRLCGDSAPTLSATKSSQNINVSRPITMKKFRVTGSGNFRTSA